METTNNLIAETFTKDLNLFYKRWVKRYKKRPVNYYVDSRLYAEIRPLLDLSGRAWVKTYVREKNTMRPIMVIPTVDGTQADFWRDVK